MKFLVFGKGNVGKAIYNILKIKNKGLKSKKLRYKFFSHSELDITDFKKVEAVIKNFKPDAIINTAAYTKVDLAEKEKDKCYAVNYLAVKNLTDICFKNNIIFVHFSTDYIFSGKNKKGYKENSIGKKPLNYYGYTKLLSENIIRHYGRKGLKYYLIRSSWIFGPFGKSFVDKILDLAKTQKELKIVYNQWGKPTYSLHLAKNSLILLTQKKHFGTYHIVNEGVTNWYNFTKNIFRIYKKINKDFKAPKILPVNSKDLNLAAKRPEYSILINTKLPKLSHHLSALKEYLLSK